MTTSLLARRLGMGLTGAAIAALASGCAASTDGTDAASSSPPVIEHVHALTVDDTTGDLIVATHAGLYALPIESGAQVEGPIAGLDFDPMGFTISGDVAYASGHPGPTTPSSFGSPNLGLITSTDGGSTWENVSLTGQTDFHSLAVSPPSEADTGTRIYGLDSSKAAVQRSLDGGETWSDGADLVARDLLADPETPGTVYATTQDGLAVSTDDAATFEIDTEAPPLYLIGADRETGLFAGIDTGGAVWTQDPAGEWVRGGTVTGVPQAFTISDGRVFVADDRGIAYSDDQGGSWTLLDLNT